MRHVRRIASIVHTEFMSLEKLGHCDSVLAGAMVRLLPDLYAVKERVSDAHMHRICSEYPGFHRFVRLMDEICHTGHAATERPHESSSASLDAPGAEL